MKESFQSSTANKKQLIAEEIEDTSKRITKQMKDHLRITANCDISDILPGEDVLVRLRNECFVDIQSLEMNKRRILTAGENNAHAYIFG
jgi:hypothetical protein